MQRIHVSWFIFAAKTTSNLPSKPANTISTIQHTIHQRSLGGPSPNPGHSSKPRIRPSIRRSACSCSQTCAGRGNSGCHSDYFLKPHQKCIKMHQNAITILKDLPVDSQCWCSSSRARWRYVSLVL